MKHHYKIYANIGQTVRTTKRFVPVLDTGTGSRFIRLHVFPEAMRKKIKKRNDVLTHRNAGGKAVPTVGTIELFVQIGTSTMIVRFLVVEKIATSVILGFNFL